MAKRETDIERQRAQREREALRDISRESDTQRKRGTGI